MKISTLIWLGVGFLAFRFIMNYKRAQTIASGGTIVDQRMVA